MDDNNPILLDRLDAHLESQFQRLVDTGKMCRKYSRRENCSAIDDAISELEALPKKDTDSGLQELRETLTDFKMFANVYYRTIRGLVGKSDHARLSLAISKIEQEIFVLRRLVEQRWSPNLRPALRLADYWSTEYLHYIKSAFEMSSPLPAAVPGAGAETAGIHVAAQLRSVANSTTAGASGCGEASTNNNSAFRSRCFTLVEDAHRIHLGVLAYKRNPTISLPLVHAMQPWHWLGLAHEVGHFVYNNFALRLVGAERSNETALDQIVRQAIFAALSDKYVIAARRQSTQHDGVKQPPLQQSMFRQVISREMVARQESACLGIAQSIPLWCSWAEELFADVLGAVTLGPAYIESLIYWMAPRIASGTALIVNDDDHPIICLRPVFQALVLLRRLGASAHAIDQHLSEVMDAWFDFCEHRFRSSEMLKADPLEVKYSSGSVDGILERVSYWRRNIRGSVSGIPLEVLFDQVKEIAEAVAAELDWAPAYSQNKHSFVVALGESTTLQEFEAVLRSMQSSPLELPMFDGSPLSLEDQCILLLSCFWQQQRGVVAGNRQLSNSQLRRVLNAIPWTPTERDDAQDQANKTVAPPTPEDAVYILCPLLQRWAAGNNADLKCGVELIEKYYDGRDGSGREERDGECPTALELADWLLSMPFAITEEVSSSCCDIGERHLGCVKVWA